MALPIWAGASGGFRSLRFIVHRHDLQYFVYFRLKLGTSTHISSSLLKSLSVYMHFYPQRHRYKRL